MGRRKENRIPFMWHPAHLWGILIVALSYVSVTKIAACVQYICFGLFLLNCLDVIITKYQLWNHVPMSPKKHQFALVTGSSAGIGREIAYLLAEKKYSVLLAARSENVMQRMKNEMESVHKVHVRYCVCDLATSQGINKLIEFVATEKLEIGILINNAGSFDLKCFHELQEEQITRLITLDLVAALRLTHAIVPQMIERKQGHVLNVASVAANLPVPRMAMYAGLKSCLDLCTQAIAYELRDTGVLVTSFNPGPVNTNIFKTNNADDTLLAKVAFLMMDPKDCAHAAIDAMFNGCERAFDSLSSRVSAFIFQSILPTRLGLAIVNIATRKLTKDGGNVLKTEK